MDFWSALLFFFLTFLILSCCGYCCTSKKRGVVLSAPVVVTSATHTTQAAAQPGLYQTNVYGSPPYPQQMPQQMPAQQQPQMQMPMPMPMPGTQPPPAGVYPQYAPYPPMAAAGSGAANINPPSYDAVIAGNSSQAVNAVYEKQSAYNPNFGTH